MIILKRLSAAQRGVFSRVPSLCQVTDRWVQFNETDAPALITALDALDIDQRTQMKCGRRVLQATGGVVEVKPRQRTPRREAPNAIKVRTSEAQRGVLTFIEKYLASGLIAGMTSDHTYVNPCKVRDALVIIQDMHTMKLNTRACHSLIHALEPYRTAPHVDTFNAAPLITPPAADPFNTAPLIIPVDEQVPAADDDDDDAAPVVSPDDVVVLPLTRVYWGDAYARVEHILTDYGYAPAADQVSVKRTHIKGLLAQLQTISIHGHAGRVIDYDFEENLDDELMEWQNII